MKRIPGLIVAAGGVVEDAGKLLLVHRPKYDDWSFPKGKLDAGESPLQAALREVREETGYTVEAGRLLGSLAYEVRAVPKVVLYWLMQPVGEPGAVMNPLEIDLLRWVSPREARALLSHELERELLDRMK